MAAGFVISFWQMAQILESFGSSTSLLLASLRSFSAGGGAGTEGRDSSIAAVVLDDNCLAKSDAYHHSRNFKKNIDVGRRTLRESKIFGKTTLEKTLGENIVQKLRIGANPGFPFFDLR